MRVSRQVHVVDSHTEGMPTRVVVGGVPVLPGSTMAERRAYLLAHLGGLRTFLMCEPRGHAAMSGALLQPSTRADADWGVLYLEVMGSVPMCGHGAMGVATVLVETGMVEVREPVTQVRLDTPAGLVVADVEVREGRAVCVTITNVASYCTALDLRVDVPGVGEVTYDLAYGGNFCAILDLDEVGLTFSRDSKDAILRAGLLILDAINETAPPSHLVDPAVGGLRHVQLLAPGSTASHSRHAMVIGPGWLDRSPCGTGTSARMAQLHRRGQLGLGSELVNESLLGTRFVGRIDQLTTVAGEMAVVPRITGRAWITGTAQLSLDPTDVFPDGFLL